MRTYSATDQIQKILKLRNNTDINKNKVVTVVFYIIFTVHNIIIYFTTEELIYQQNLYSFN